MTVNLDVAKFNAKSVGSFVVSLAVFLGLLAAVPGIAALFPATWIAILVAIGAAGSLAATVWGIPNKLTTDQIVKGAIQNGIPIVTAAVQSTSAAVSGAVTSYIEAAASGLPAPVHDQVTNIAHEVPDLVNSVINDFIERVK